MSKITTATTGVGTTETTIYTCPAGKETTISRFSITGTKDITDLKLKYYNSASSSIISLVDSGVVNSGDTVSYISNSNTLTMNPADYLSALSNVDNSLDIIVTYEETDA